VLAELASFQIRFKNAELQNPRNRRRATHESGSEYSSPPTPGSKLERESCILLVFRHKAKDAEMSTIGHIEHCAEALVWRRVSPRRMWGSSQTAQILLQGAAHFLTTNRGTR